MNLNVTSLLRSPHAVILLALGLVAAAPVTHAASSVGDAFSNAAEDVKEEAVETWDHFWQSIEPYRLKNRSRDEIAAWLIIGLMMGGLAGAVATMRRTGLGPWINFGIGLLGAFIGGIIVHKTRLDFGWGPVLIRYEEVAAAFAGSLVIILLSRLALSKWRKNRARS